MFHRQSRNLAYGEAASLGIIADIPPRGVVDETTERKEFLRKIGHKG